MGKTCCVSTCKAAWTPDKRLSFFSFARDEELKQKWINAAPVFKTLSKSSLVCSNHFLPTDYTNWTEYGSKRILKKNAIPSVFHNVSLESCDEIPDNIHCNESSALQENQSDHDTFNLRQDDARQKSSRPYEDEEHNQPPPKRFCSIAVQTCERLSGSSTREKELQKKIKMLQDRLRKKEKRITNVTEIITQLKESGMCSDNLENTLLKKFTNLDLELFKNQSTNRTKGKNARVYTPEMKEFASTLYFYSPRAYEYVRAKISLPHGSTLRKWISDYSIDAGFIDNVFLFLTSEVHNKEYLRDVALIFDGMAIRKQLLFDPKADKCRGLVDYGPIDSNMKSEINYGNTATDALVFQKVSYKDKFECPIANFFIAGCSAKVQAHLLLQAIKKLHEAGVIVRSLTCDGCSVDEGTLKLLGCEFDIDHLVTYFKHPSNESYIHVFMDPSHMGKLCRNTFAETRIFSSRGEIRFSYTIEQEKIQNSEGLKLANRLTSSHIKYRQKKMKVSLAMQTISSSVADAIDFLRLAGYNQFQGSEATCEFMRIFDRLFDIQNTRSAFGRGFKSPMSLSNRMYINDCYFGVY